MAGSGPFGGDPLGYGNTWLVYGSGKKVHGGEDVGRSVELGVQNDIGLSGKKYFSNPTTIVSVGNPSGGDTAVFAALNGGGETGKPGDTTAGVGIFGQSVAGDGIASAARPLTNGIGVAGSCNTGCGVFGQSHYGSGVVGFATPADMDWGSWAYWGTTLAPTFQNAGVLGQSKDGVGVRGHGGTLTDVNGLPAQPPPGKPPSPTTPTAATQSAPGGWFSSGLLASVADNLIPEGRLISRSSQPQLRLVPSMPDNRRFPAMGAIGDFFLVTNVDLETNLYLCLKINPETRKPVWTKVMLDLSFDSDGGSSL